MAANADEEGHGGISSTAQITGSPEKSFHVQSVRDLYFERLAESVVSDRQRELATILEQLKRSPLLDVFANVIRVTSPVEICDFMPLRRANVIVLQHHLNDEITQIRHAGKIDPASMRHVRTLLNEYDEALKEIAMIDPRIAADLRAAQTILMEMPPGAYAGVPGVQDVQHLQEIYKAMERSQGQMSARPTSGVFRFFREYLPPLLRLVPRWLEVVAMPPSTKRNRQMAALVADMGAMFYRMIVAATGGFFVVIPILIMSFNPSRTKNLITTCVFVFVFASSLATTSKASEQELLAATAAYAAVLVVFVGAITAPIS